jgi:ABC-type molybdate transport system substrate-binding protein
MLRILVVALALVWVPPKGALPAITVSAAVSLTESLQEIA